MIHQDNLKSVVRLLRFLWLCYVAALVLGLTLYHDLRRSPFTWVLGTLSILMAYLLIVRIWIDEDFFGGGEWTVVAPYRKWIIGIPLAAEAVRLISGLIVEGPIAFAFALLAVPAEVTIWVMLGMWTMRGWFRLRERWRARKARRIDVSDADNPSPTTDYP